MLPSKIFFQVFIIHETVEINILVINLPYCFLSHFPSGILSNILVLHGLSV